LPGQDFPALAKPPPPIPATSVPLPSSRAARHTVAQGRRNPPVRLGSRDPAAKRAPPLVPFRSLHLSRQFPPRSDPAIRFVFQQQRYCYRQWCRSFAPVNKPARLVPAAHVAVSESKYNKNAKPVYAIRAS